MKIKNGFYASLTIGNVPAIWIEMSKRYSVGVADWGGAHHFFNSESDFIETNTEEKEKSIIFPKVTDFFSPEIKSLQINITL